MWKPTVRIADEELEQKIKIRLLEDGKTVQELVVDFLTKYGNREEQETIQEVVQLTPPEKKERPEGELGPEDFPSHFDYIDYLEKNNLLKYDGL